MPLSKLKNIRIDFSLFDEKNKPKAKLPIFIQYYEVTTNAWISIYVDTITKGVLSIEETTKSRAKALLSFFNILKNNQIPELRIIAQKDLYNLEKFQVLTSLYAFTFDEEQSVLHFDFGTAYLLQEDLLKEQQGFKDFIVVTSPYSFAYQNQLLDTSLQQCITNTKTLEGQLDKSKTQLTAKQKQYTEVTNTLKTATKTHTDLSKAHSDLEANFKSLANDANDCQEEKEALHAALHEVQQELEVLHQKNVKLQTQNESLTTSLNDAKQDIERLAPFEEKYQASQKEYDALNGNYTESIQALEHCAKGYTALQDAYALLQKEQHNYLEQLEICSAEKAQSEKERLEANATIIALDTKYNTAVEDLSLKNTEIKQLQLKIDALSKDVAFDLRPMPVSGVYTNIVNEIQLADSLNNSDYKLSNIQLKIKSLVNRDQDGVNLQFLNHETAKEINGNSISEVILDIESAPREVNKSGTLPNLIGFTETAIRRILNNLGLRLNPVYQKNKNVPSGESFKQSPTLNSNIQNNQLITVIFSKNE
ncbi:PASTA domain-containing protein [Olleya sp. Bg11-27]|uniref:PASTA domain-containing protein n=1 Tax=Olleya sp. Bg11-27 TaxID=2058135 RepID=UPI000C31046E|nr:PASTA domain-containing protein [Olleya sp. Bg11-27]AUC76453.1 hypothetical protein CW732_12550 [Olleya sp. Bg11-27]